MDSLIKDIKQSSRKKKKLDPYLLDSYCSKILIQTKNETIKTLEEIWGELFNNQRVEKAFLRIV